MIKEISLLTAETFKIFPGRSVVAMLFMVVVALLDALSVVSLIPAIEFLSRSNDVSGFTDFINGFFVQMGVTPGLVSYFGLSAIIIILKSVARFASKSFTLRIQRDFELHMNSACLETILFAEGQFLDRQENGSVANLLANEVNKIGDCLFYIYDYVAVVLKFVCYASVLFAFSVPLVIAIVITSVLTFLPSLLLGRAIYKASERRLTLSHASVDYLGQVLTNVTEIKSYVAENVFLQRYRDRLKPFKAEHERMLLLRDLTGILLEPFGIIQITLVVYLCLQQFQLTFAETLVVLFTLRNVLPLFGLLMTYKQVIISSIPSYLQVRQLLQEGFQRRENYSGKRLSEFKNTIEFSAVDFSYDNTKIIERFDLVIKRGQAVALVGPSGAGKSTLVKLLLGILRPKQGQVLVDGVDLAELSISDWRTLVSFVPQEPILLKASLRQNVAMGVEHIDEKRLARAVDRACLTQFVAKLPHGIDTVIGEAGVSISSGQKQRLSIARALYKDSPIIVLDEPTSALDAETEQSIKRILEQLRGEKTIMIIAHRLNTIAFCDQILVLESGVVRERGSFDELMRENGKFKSLVTAQRH